MREVMSKWPTPRSGRCGGRCGDQGGGAVDITTTMMIMALPAIMMVALRA
jgi:hypothetical protein